MPKARPKPWVDARPPNLLRHSARALKGRHNGHPQDLRSSSHSSSHPGTPRSYTTTGDLPAAIHDRFPESMPTM